MSLHPIRGGKVDSNGGGGNNQRMDTAITRPELDARLELIETRMDARVQRIEETGKAIQSEMHEIRSELKNQKWWMIGTGLTVVLGIAAFNATVLSNMVASFESGKNTSATVIQAQQRIDSVENKVNAVDAKVNAVEQKVSAVEQKVNTLGGKVDSIDKKLDALIAASSKTRTEK